MSTLKEALEKVGFKSSMGKEIEKAKQIGEIYLDKAVVDDLKHEISSKSKNIYKYPSKHHNTFFDPKEKNSETRIIYKKDKEKKTMEKIYDTVMERLLQALSVIKAAPKAEIIDRFVRANPDAKATTLHTFLSNFAMFAPNYIQKYKNEEGVLIYQYTPNHKNLEEDIEDIKNIYFENLDKRKQALKSLRESNPDLTEKKPPHVHHKKTKKNDENLRMERLELMIEQMAMQIQGLSMTIQSLVDYEKSKIKEKLSQEELTILNL